MRGVVVDSHASTIRAPTWSSSPSSSSRRPVQPGGRLGEHEGGGLAAGGTDEERRSPGRRRLLDEGGHVVRDSPRRARGTRGSCARRRPARGRRCRRRRADAAAGAPAAGGRARPTSRQHGQRRSSRAEPGQEVDVVAAYRRRDVEPGGHVDVVEVRQHGPQLGESGIVGALGIRGRGGQVEDALGAAGQRRVGGHRGRVVDDPAVVLGALHEHGLEGRDPAGPQADPPAVGHLVQLEAVHEPAPVDAAELGAGPESVAHQVVEAVDVELAVDDAVEAVGPVVAHAVGQDEPDELPWEVTEAVVRKAVDDPQSRPLVELGLPGDARRTRAWSRVASAPMMGSIRSW